MNHSVCLPVWGAWDVGEAGLRWRAVTNPHSSSDGTPGRMGWEGGGRWGRREPGFPHLVSCLAPCAGCLGQRRV